MQMCTSDAPASLMHLIFVPIILAYTTESIRTIFFPLKFELKGPNFFRIASCRRLVLG
ncbi:hypothetical protein X975_14125, partial [Stegodyphus mimosarum]